MTLSKSPFFKSHQLFSRKPLNKFAILHAPTLKEKSTEEKHTHTHTNIRGKSPRVKTHDTHTHTFDDTLYHFHKVYHRKFRRPWTHSWRGWHLRSLSKTFLFFHRARARTLSINLLCHSPFVRLCLIWWELSDSGGWKCCFLFYLNAGKFGADLWAFSTDLVQYFLVLLFFKPKMLQHFYPRPTVKIL